ncbi:glycosyltransferase [Knoellia sp. CPCC 206450]|uniref:glycosyltransferase n=1 Tax=Knoellia tibetensis TaxID=3404798 RepID=UPI003B4339DD
MKVLVMHSRYRSTAPSGENAVVDQEVGALRAHGVDVDLFQRSSDDIADWSLARKAGLPLRSIHDAGLRRSLVTHLQRSRPDVVHLHNTFPLLSPAVLDACAEAGVPVVATIHNYKLLCASGDFFRKGEPCHACAGGRWAPALRHGCYRGSVAATLPVAAGLGLNRRRWQTLVSAFIFISAAQRDLMAGLQLPDERLFVRHHFVPGPAAGTAVRDHRVAYVGRLDEAKGLPLLLAGWSAFREMRPHSTLRLHVAGGGPLQGALQQWAQGRDEVRLHGLLSRPAVSDLIAGSLAVVVPSVWEETFGLVAVEAMAAGVAPIAPGRGSFPELVRDGVDGVLVPPGDPSALASAFCDVDDDPARWRAMGRAGRGSYSEHFEVRAAVAQLLDIYDYAIGHAVGVAGAEGSAGGPAGGRRGTAVPERRRPDHDLVAGEPSARPPAGRAPRPDRSMS